MRINKPQSVGVALDTGPFTDQVFWDPRTDLRPGQHREKEWEKRCKVARIKSKDVYQVH